MSVADRPAQYAEFLDSAGRILERRTGADAITEIGVADLLRSEGTRMLPAAYAFLEMQGFHTASSHALSIIALADARLGDEAGLDAYETVLIAPFSGMFDRGPAVVLGSPEGCRYILDVPGRGLIEIPPDCVSISARGVDSGDEYADTISFESALGTVLLPEDGYRRFRAQVFARARVGAAAEMLGACRRLLENAIEHATNRVQFGAPIASFQAIQHSLAWAATDRHQLTLLVDEAVRQSAEGNIDVDLADAVKALAGSVSRRISQIALQATGAMGFTWEYSHNQLNRRCMVLDHILGSSDELHAGIGRRIREEHAVAPLIDLREVNETRLAQ